MFEVTHNLDRLGSQGQAIDKIVKAVLEADKEGVLARGIRPDGVFRIERTIDGWSTTITGRIMDGELRISDAWIPR